MAHALATAYRGLIRAMSLAAALILGVLAVLISLDVALRNLGIVTFPWLLELSEYALFAATFLAAPWVLRIGGHVRVDVLISVLPARASALLRALALVAGALGSAVLAWHGLRITVEAFSRGNVIAKELVVPEWWLLAFIPLSSAVLAAEFVRQLLGAPAEEDEQAAARLGEGI